MTASVTFAGVRGHARALDFLRRAARADRVPHAYLFGGPEGVGKRQVARALAARLNCARGDALDDACGSCSSCERIDRRSHPDIIEVAPDGKFIKVDQVRAISALTSRRPYEGRRRVVLFDQAETLKDEASNAFLKTLEEPRGDSMFILISANPERLLATIRSRCQPLRFGPLSVAEVTAVLDVLLPDVDPAARGLRARLSEGSPGRAWVEHETAGAVGRRDVARQLAHAVEEGGELRMFAWVDALLKSGVALRDVLATMRSLLRDAMLVAAGASRERLRNVDLYTEIDGLVDGRDARVVHDMLARVLEAEALLDANVHPKMTMDSLLLALARSPQRTLSAGLR